MKVIKFPTIVITICLILGILISNKIKPDVYLALLIVLVAIVPFFVFYFLIRKNLKFRISFGISSYVLAFTIGIFLFAIHYPKNQASHYSNSAYRSSEKNLVSGIISEKLKPNRFKLLAVGYNLRFHPAIIWLQETLPQLGAVSSVNFYVGQYLPTWRPDSDYRTSSSAKTDSGGGVLRDLSHELDLVQYIFGDWKKMTAVGGKFSDLEIETDDTFSILLQTDQCPAVSVQMNYSDRLRQRLITVNGNNGTIQIDLVSNSATFNNSQKSFDVHPDSTYISQHNAVIQNQDLSICSLADALKVVATIEAVEKSAKKSKWITK